MSAAAPAPGQSIEIPNLPNLRDVGGYAGAGGRTVRRGVLYRSVALSHLEEEGAEALRPLAIETIFDLRSAAEREASPDRDVGAREVHLDVMADRVGTGPGKVLSLMEYPDAIAEHLGDGGAEALMDSAYRELVELPSADASYSRLFAELAELDGASLVHCTTGKDRTGWAAASLLLFLGVSEEEVMRDYMLTNEQLTPFLEPIVRRFAENGGDAEMLRPVLSVNPEYLGTALGLVEDRYGSIEGYFSEGLGLGDETLSALRDRMLG